MPFADHMTDNLDVIAGAAWARLRNLLGALDRVDRLETSSEFDGWLRQLATDDEALAPTLRDFLLRVLRAACEPVNTLILRQLTQRGPLSAGALGAALNLSRVDLVERLNDLARAGLTVQALDGELVEATPLALGFVALVEEISLKMAMLARSDHLLNPEAPLPAPPAHRRRLDLKAQG